jgi:short-subunit dehydrogenase
MAFYDLWSSFFLLSRKQKQISLTRWLTPSKLNLTVICDRNRLRANEVYCLRKLETDNKKMKLKPNQTVLLTGASGGLGTYIARALAAYGLNQALVAFPGKDLPPLKEELEKNGISAYYLVADLRIKDERERVVNEVSKTFGQIDILINNAGVEFTAPYHALSEDDINSVIEVNLEAPMQLTRLVIPYMLERRSGHIVNMSSLAGKAGPAYQEPYAATKSGLIAFTMALRETYFRSGVSASAICPGFVEAGIYARLKERSGCSAPALLGTSRPEKVGEAVIRAIQNDIPQVIINPYPVRPLLALSEISPRLGAWLARAMGGSRFFKRAYKARKEREEQA